MIRLRDLLDEKVTGVQWLNKAYRFSYGYMIPATPKIGNILYGEQRIRAFHITSPGKLKQLDSIQGTKKSISCMTRVPPGVYGGGIIGGVWHTGVMFYLEGTLLLQNSGDAGTAPDEQGRRWMGLPAPYDTYWENVVDNDTPLKGIKGMIDGDIEIEPKVLKKYGDKVKNYLQNKRLVRYIELAEKFVVQHKDGIKTNNLKNKMGDWDEVLLNDIELIDVIWDNANGDRRQILSQLKSMVSGEVVAPNPYKGSVGREFVISRKVK